jgi:hypothetical protein
MPPFFQAAEHPSGHLSIRSGPLFLTFCENHPVFGNSVARAGLVSVDYWQRPGVRRRNCRLLPGEVAPFPLVLDIVPTGRGFGVVVSGRTAIQLIVVFLPGMVDLWKLCSICSAVS